MSLVSGVRPGRPACGAMPLRRDGGGFEHDQEPCGVHLVSCGPSPRGRSACRKREAEDLLSLVQVMLFSDVRATIAVQMMTSPSTGPPATRSELLDIQSLAE